MGGGAAAAAAGGAGPVSSSSSESESRGISWALLVVVVGGRVGPIAGLAGPTAVGCFGALGP